LTESPNPDRSFPPKPLIAEKTQNSTVRSLVSLFMYGLLFYFLFDRNIKNIAAILVVLIIHEAGHFSFMKIYRYSNVKIFIIPLLGAFTSGKKQNVSQKHLVTIILAGPLPGMLIGTALYLYNADLKDQTIRMLADTFMFINLLNCLPFHPLDGGRLIETLFFRENFIIRMVFGVLSVLALTVLSLFLMSPFLLIIPVLIGIEIFNEIKYNKIRDYLRQERIDHFTDFNALPDKDYWLIRDCLIFSFPKKYGMLAPGKYEYSIIEPVIVQHVNSVLQVKLNSDMSPVLRFVVLVFYLLIMSLAIVAVSLYR
jgi:stage IV sporulation protein FB